MYHLRVLGSLQITGPDGRLAERLAGRSRRAALLAYLGAVRPSLCRRDRLLGMFWPESDDFHARAALNQALYVLRSELGEEAILTRGDEVRLNPDAIWCDVTAFEMALDAGSLVSALSLYRGNLLDGFYVTGAPEFEHWAESERGRLRHLAAEAAWKLAESTAAQGNLVEAEHWARMATGFLPADEAVARRLMTFFHNHGDRAAAIQAYETFVATLQREYELEPSAETSSLATAIRVEEQREVPVQLAAPSVAGLRQSIAERTIQARVRPRRTYALAALAGIVALGAFGLRSVTPNGQAAPPATAGSIGCSTVPEPQRER